MFIIVIKGNNVGTLFLLDKDGPIIIGREKECDIRILDLMVSRKHCQIEKKGNIFYIKDLGSTNKTLVNKNVIEKETELKLGDIITIGETVLFFTDQKEMPIKNVADYEKLRINQTMRFDMPC